LQPDAPNWPCTTNAEPTASAFFTVYRGGKKVTVAELKKMIEQMPDDFEMVFETDEYLHFSFRSIKRDDLLKQVTLYVD
jgi:hypothetical protein